MTSTNNAAKAVKGKAMPTLNFEYGQTFQTPNHPDGLIVALWDGGLSFRVSHRYSPQDVAHWEMTRRHGTKGPNLSDYRFTELGINHSAQVEMNGSQISLADLVERFHDCATDLSAQGRLLPSVKRHAPGYAIILAGTAAAVVGSIAIHPAFVSGLATVPIGAYVDSRLNSGITQKSAERHGLSETLRLAFLEQGKKAGTLPPNYGAIRFVEGGGYVAAERR